MVMLSLCRLHPLHLHLLSLYRLMQNLLSALLILILVQACRLLDQTNCILDAHNVSLHTYLAPPRSHNVGLTSSHQKTQAWMSWAEVQNKFGQAEAVRRLKKGSLKARRDPEGQEFWQFLSTTETATDTLKRTREVCLKTDNKVDKHTRSILSGSLNDIGCAEDAEQIWDGQE